MKMVLFPAAMAALAIGGCATDDRSGDRDAAPASETTATTVGEVQGEHDRSPPTSNENPFLEGDSGADSVPSRVDPPPRQEDNEDLDRSLAGMYQLMGGVEPPARTQFVNYYSFERLRQGPDLDLTGDNEALIFDVLLRHDPSFLGGWGLVSTFLQLRQGVFIPIQLESASAVISMSAHQESLYAGDFDPDRIVEFWREYGFNVEPRRFGDHVVLSGLDDDPPDDVLFQIRRAVENVRQVVSRTEYVNMRASVDVSEHFDRRFNTRPQPEVDELLALLDHRDVYSAYVILSQDFAGLGFDEAWGLAASAPTAAAATSIAEGSELSHLLLWHSDTESARANAAVVGDLMDHRAPCSSRPTVEFTGTIVAASCPTDGVSWGRRVAQSYPNPP